MALDATARRRWVGAVILVSAVGMVVCGQTVLRDRMAPLQALVYWLVCLGLTGLAIFVALLDMRALARRSLREQRELLDATVKKIQSEVAARPRPPARTRRRS